MLDKTKPFSFDHKEQEPVSAAYWLYLFSLVIAQNRLASKTFFRHPATPRESIPGHRLGCVGAGEARYMKPLTTYSALWWAGMHCG